MIAARSVDVSEKNVLRDVPSSEELEAAGELRAELGEQPARWLETGELLRFVRARKTLKERASLFREAMAWRRDHPDWIEDDASFGGAERRWCDDPATAPAWHRSVHKSNCRGASPPLLNHGLHAIDATSSPTHWLICAQALLDGHGAAV